jgi:site-specific DNA-methyltransferase (adenine-specific)
VPQQSWDRTWTDADLYEKYGITDDEVTFINSMIRPMEGGVGE